MKEGSHLSAPQRAQEVICVMRARDLTDIEPRKGCGRGYFREGVSMVTLPLLAMVWRGPDPKKAFINVLQPMD
jgi:hypothetical protein